eukprot:2610665-Amphidinium_carterae.2
MGNTGIFPAFDPDEVDGSSDFFNQIVGFANYTSVEQDTHAEQELKRLVHQGYLLQFDSLSACQSYLGISPRLSKLGMVSKEQVAPDGASTTKR